MNDDSREYARQVATTINSQIHWGAKAALGASDLAATIDVNGNPGLAFNARILPFNKNGERSRRPRLMRVTITLNLGDLYDVRVMYGTYALWVEHFHAADVYCDELTPLMLALDWDGPTATNPRYWPGGAA